MGYKRATGTNVFECVLVYNEAVLIIHVTEAGQSISYNIACQPSNNSDQPYANAQAVQLRFCAVA